MIDNQIWSGHNLYTPEGIEQSFIMETVPQNNQQSPYAEPLRSDTGGSGSSNGSTNEIIPGGAFEGFEAQNNNRHVPSPLSLGGIGNFQNAVNYPQTPHNPTGTAFSNANTGASSPFGSSPHNVPSQSSDGGIGSAIRIIDERTRHMNMSSPLTSAPASYSPLKPSPLNMSGMRPSAFRIPMTPTYDSPQNDAIGNMQPRSIMFASPQSITHFTPGPPQQFHATQHNSLSSSLEVQPRGMASFGDQGHSSYGSAGLSGSLTGSSACGYPSTPMQQQLPSIHGYGERTSLPVKVEQGGEDNAAFGQYLPATQHVRNQQQCPDAPLSLGGSPQSHFNPRQYHPYRSPQSEPVNRVASNSVARQFPPPSPPMFAFGLQLGRPSMNGSRMSVQPQDMFSVPSADSGVNFNTKHHHTGSLEFAVPKTPAAYCSSGISARPPFFQSMSLPNHASVSFPTSPEGQSLQTESDDFDQDGTGMSRSPQMVTPALGGFGLQQSPKSPKKHVCQVCGKAFNRPSSLNTHMTVHTGAKPHQCPKRACGRKFSVSSNLRRHMKTHEVKDQQLVPQMTSHQETDATDFDMGEQVQVKAEPQEPGGMVNVQLQDDQQELVNGSIVYDENGRAYRYYSSQSDYQAAQHLDLPNQGLSSDLSAMQEQPQLLAPVPLTHELSTSATDFGFPLQAQLGNAAPSMSVMNDPSSTDVNQAAFSGFGMWTRDGAAMDMSEGISLPRPLALGNAGFSM